MENTMVKQPASQPKKPVEPPVNWNAPLTRGDFEKGIGALDKKVTSDIGALDKKVTSDIGALDKKVTEKIGALDTRITVVESKVDALDKKVEAGRTENREDFKAVTAEIKSGVKYLTKAASIIAAVVTAVLTGLKYFPPS